MFYLHFYFILKNEKAGCLRVSEETGSQNLF